MRILLWRLWLPQEAAGNRAESWELLLCGWGLAMLIEETLMLWLGIRANWHTQRF